MRKYRKGESAISGERKALPFGPSPPVSAGVGPVAGQEADSDIGSG